MNAPDAGTDGGTKDGSVSDATPDQTVPPDSSVDGAPDGGHFVDGSTEGGSLAADAGFIGGGGCACNAAGRRDSTFAGGAFAALFALAGWAKRRRRNSNGP